MVARPLCFTPRGKSLLHVPYKRADQSLGYETSTTEMEVLNWLHALVLVLKPKCILETGAAAEIGTLALASACKANGFGVVHSVEIDSTVQRAAAEKLRQAGLTDYVKWSCADSCEFIRCFDGCFDFGFFGSLCGIRAEECRFVLERNKLCGPAVFHDTSPLRTRSLSDDPPAGEHAQFRQEVYAIAEGHYGGRILESALSRGFIALFPEVK
jgi:predicted RNA methylase